LKQPNNIRHSKGICTQIFFVYQTVAYSQMAIHCILHIDADKRRHCTVVPPEHTWGSIRHQSN